MKTTIKSSVALFCMGIAFLGVAAVVGKAQSPIVNAIHAGGPDVQDPDLPFDTGPGVDKNYSLIAFKYADGSASGRLVDRWAGPAGTTMLRADINCVHVVGNTVWVSGEIKQGILVSPDGTSFDLAGRYVRTAVQDNGDNNDLENPDRIGFSTQRRRVLGPFDCTLMLGDLFDMPRGQVTVR